MAEHKINIELRADSGKAVDAFGKVGKASTDLIVNIKKLGGAFGDFGGIAGNILSNIFKGGIWGIMTAAVQGALSLFNKWRNSAKEAAEAVSEAMKKSAEEASAAITKINQAYKDEVSSIDKVTASTIKQIEATKKLAVATQELARQRALAAGDADAAAKAEGEIAAITAKSEKEKEAAYVRSYQKRLEAAQAAEKKLEGRFEAASMKAGALVKQRDAILAAPGRRGDRSVKFVEGDRSIWNAANADTLEAFRILILEKGGFGRGDADTWLRRRRDNLYKMRRKHFLESDKGKALVEGVKTANASSSEAWKALENQRAAIAEIKAEEERRIKENAAKRIGAEAKAVASEIAAAKAAAAERDRLDRELHQKRMADLKAEMAAQKEAASPLRATVAAAQSEFERAFAMYRDPSQAAAQIGEERDRADDLKRLHKDAARYGGKWRIDELSQLMSAGDSAGVQSRLEDWRKSRSFTPEVEAMVRASAAEQTKTTAEDELRKLNDKTVELSQKIESLAQARDGKLDGIERNTNQLANKLDELLQVKG